MHEHQSRVLDLALRCDALRFGQFTLKSGRLSPYFFNAGRFDHGAALGALGDCYARTLLASGIGLDMIFGPAYKGIPLATTTAIALAANGRDVPVHRVVYEALTGADITGLDLDHLCRNPGCVNPAHHEPVTHAENQRRIAKMQNECRRAGHDWSDPRNVRVRPNGARYCAECDRIDQRRRRRVREAA